MHNSFVYSLPLIHIVSYPQMGVLMSRKERRGGGLGIGWGEKSKDVLLPRLLPYLDLHVCLMNTTSHPNTGVPNARPS